MRRNWVCDSLLRNSLQPPADYLVAACPAGKLPAPVAVVRSVEAAVLVTDHASNLATVNAGGVVTTLRTDGANVWRMQRVDAGLCEGGRFFSGDASAPCPPVASVPAAPPVVAPHVSKKYHFGHETREGEGRLTAAEGGRRRAAPEARAEGAAEGGGPVEARRRTR